MSQFDPLGMHGTQYQNKYSQAENNQFTVEFSEITKGFLEALSEGLDPASAQVQELVRQHYGFCSKFWTPNKEAYQSLAMSYILPTAYRDTYESQVAGLGKYHYDAIVIWSERNL